MAPSATETCQEYKTLNIEKGLIKPATKSVEHGSSHQQGSIKSDELIANALNGRIGEIDGETCEADEESAFFVADLGEVYRQHMRWKKNLRRVKPHYAVKCNPDPYVLKLLAALGTGFDCASKAEIEQVLKLGVDPSRIIYAQPCKTKSYLRYAAQKGVRQMTFDNSDELHKIKQVAPDAELFLRILTDDSASLCRLSLKFGAALDATRGLLELAKKLGLNMAGVAFHVGSGASDPNAFLKAVDDARFVFDQAKEIGYDLRALDVGGGFVGDTFEEMAEVLSEALNQKFPSHVRVIGEPGRFYVSSAFTIACHVISRRIVEESDLGPEKVMLYLNDGVYGNFSSIIFDHQQPIPRILKRHRKFPISSSAGIERDVEYSIWGPTCDGIDCISSSSFLSGVVDVGDWLFFQNMGAYTKCSATQFNGFTNKHDAIYICGEPAASALLAL